METPTLTKILIVDDSPDSRDLIAKILLGQKIPSDAVNTAERGIDCLQESLRFGQSYTAIITDYDTCSSKNGLHLVHEAKSLAQPIPIILMSGDLIIPEPDSNDQPGGLYATILGLDPTQRPDRLMPKPYSVGDVKTHLRALGIIPV